MDAYPVFSAFIGCLAAMILVKALFHQRLHRDLVLVAGHLIPVETTFRHMADIASSSNSSDASALSISASAMLAGIAGSPSSISSSLQYFHRLILHSVASTSSCKLTEELKRLAARDSTHSAILREVAGPPSSKLRYGLVPVFSSACTDT